MNVTLVKQSDGIDALTTTTYTTASGTTADATIAFTTTTATTTAFITSITVEQALNGAPQYTTWGRFFSAGDNNTYPVMIKSTAPGLSSSHSLSAFGNDSAVGAQRLTWTVTLSPFCLSAFEARAPVANPVQTFVTTVTALNTPYNQYTSLQEFQRMWNLQG